MALLVVSDVRSREYYVAGEAPGVKRGGNAKIALGYEAVLDGLSGSRRRWLGEPYTVVGLHDFIVVIGQNEARLNDLLREIPTSLR